MRVLFAGDVVLSRPFEPSIGLQELLASHDYCLANLEAPFRPIGAKPAIKAGPLLESKKEFLAGFAEHFQVVSLANNHAWDWGEAGLSYSLELLAQVGIRTIGAGPQAFASVTLGDCKVVALAEHEFGAAGKTPRIATWDQFDQVAATLNRLGPADVLFYHGGTECLPLPLPYLRRRLKGCRQWVGLVIGSHPHVPQGYEAGIYYSLGNFFFSVPELTRYPGHDWSILVSWDSSAQTAKSYYVKNNQLVDLDKEFLALSSLLSRPDYEECCATIANKLFPIWMPELTRAAGDIPFLLHHLRCDSHNFLAQLALSARLGEVFTTNKVEMSAPDVIRIV